VGHRDVRRRIVLTGAVQGVGMRPFVFRLAGELGLAGFVGNDSTGAFVEVEGETERVETFTRRLTGEAPPLARVEAVTVAEVTPTGATAFEIVASQSAIGERTLVPPDASICDACLAEIRDPADRRYRHPFANYTDCGPRFTIIRDLPYDRPVTTMAGFPLCDACAAEYRDPRDRRYHAQPVSCPECGPQLTFRRGEEELSGTDAAIAAVHAAWARGEVVAVKGIGGYHLTCNAADAAAVTRLRERKGRVGKPFAVMVRDVPAAGALIGLDPVTIASLTSVARPIVLAPRRAGAPVCEAVAPGLEDLGVMIAYSALHDLLLTPVPGVSLDPPSAIVATSGNRSSEPICVDDEEARVRLADLADAFLVHDRGIAVACDDSVVRILAGVERPVRRSRGYAPMPVTLPLQVVPSLAIGGELKSTFCLASGSHAWISQHIGDVENLETLEALARSVDDFTRMYRVTPEVVAVDAHPGYLSRRWAIEHAAGADVVEVQHHHAHVASLMAESGLDGSAPVLGIAFDGTGYGSALGGGPAIWGGELLIADYDGFERAGHLAELPLPGGDAAIRDPWRVAVAYAAACGLELDGASGPARAGGERGCAIVRQQVASGVGVVPTTSVGRLFDAVASLLDVRHEVTYEGQAAIELERLARSSAGAALSFDLSGDAVLDPRSLLAVLTAAQAEGVPAAPLARGFHEALARAVATAAGRLCRNAGIRVVALSGGVFQNGLLSALCRARLADLGLEVLEHRTVPANDGGLALGQAAIGARAHHGHSRRW
jgi:hydrogenase maturation protein HypF